MGDEAEQAEGLQQLQSELQRELAQDFHDLLKEFARFQAIGTDELLSAVLPLFKQTAELHDDGKVAPLDGYEHVRAYRRRLFLGPGAAQKPNWNPMAVNQIQGSPLQTAWGDGLASRPMGGLAALKQSLDEEDPGRLIAGRGRAPTKPCFMLDYRAWEHAVGNHDPLTDIFSLGMLAASLATGLDFTEEADLAEFARHRRHLVQLNSRLHPVVADILCRMTELDRRDRIQELGRVVHGLEHHRQLAQPAIGAESETPLAREGEILKELRGRLYDLSRRNKLLHHKPSNAELNLTEASTPIVLHVDAIRPEQLLTWSGEPAQRVAAGEAISLTEFIRFEEMTHAPAVLDKIRAQARRDKTEFGFSQLRLVICFLRWRNLKDDPETPINSPLLLLPVELKKRRGVRDSYDLQAMSSEAEVNPTLRRYLKLVYNVDLPAAVDLTEKGSIDALHRLLQDQIARSEPGVKLEKISVPNIRAMHQRAQRRVDLYRTRNKPSGGQKRLGDILYSYNNSSNAHFRPLGAQLFRRFVEPCKPPRRPQGLKGAAEQLVGKSVEDSRQLALSIDIEELRRAATATTRPKEASKAKESIGRSDQRLWAFDLCSVTLANFNYRKMSLVRDFDALLDKGVGDPKTGATVADALGGRATAFEKLFADGPKPMAGEPPSTPLLERFPVVAADPTQEAAVLRSRTGESYVIQGPPGTGKSQTIANLIADFLGRGKRVLFVCEKRAALDVVFHRLESLGLHRLCARVHDSQDDKKSFILDLKALFEGWLDAAPNESIEGRRREAAEAVQNGLAAFEALDHDMLSDADGERFHHLVAMAAAAIRPSPIGAEQSAPEPAGKRKAAAEPEAADDAEAEGEDAFNAGLAAAALRHGLEQGEIDLLPSLREWRAGRAAAREAEAALKRIDPTAPPILAKHPARFVSAEASADPQLFERLESALEALEPHMRVMKPAMDKLVWPKRRGPAPLSALFAQIDYASRLKLIAVHGDLAIFDSESGVRQRFDYDLRMLDLARENLALAQSQTVLWRDKLTALETDAALRLALQHEGSFLGFMSGPWRVAKAEVTKRTGLDELSIKPTIVQLLTDLQKEHEAAAEVESHLRQLAMHLGMTDGEAAIQIVDEIDRKRPEEGRSVEPLMDKIAREGKGATPIVLDLAELKAPADAARASLAVCFEGLETLPMGRAFDALQELQKQRSALPAVAPALRALAQAPASVRAALRRIETPVDRIEAAIIDRTVERALAVRPAARESSGPGLDAQAEQIGASLSRLREANAEALLDGARRRFVEHVSLTARLELELDPERQAERRQFVEARQDLERELAKSMRFRSIRELMAGAAGHLIRDLKPIWLMSPLSVADILPLQPDLFDVVIFDEASQVPVEEAAPTLFRAPQAIVVGDEKQLPPTNFFGGGDGEADLWDEAGAEDDGAPSLDLDADSFLGQAARSLPSTMLGWHYRSRAEELIAFSNALFYGGRLISIPSATRLDEREPIEAESAKDGEKLWSQVLERPISWHRTPFGVYERQRNTGEAEYVAELVRGLLKAQTGKSIGVVAFSEAQQSEIERALDRLAKSDAKFRNLYEAELEREEDGQFAGLFVKNLENVQGDERDIIIVSVCYGPDANGRMRMNFGPINRAGGEKRLNVIFSRAKDRLALVSTISADAITNDYNTGALCLKTYIRYAEAVSRGDREAMIRCLSHVAPQALAAADRPKNPLADSIAQALRERGWQVETALGQSAFVCDLAIRPPKTAKGKSTGEPLAVLIDGPAHFATGDLMERYVVKPAVLKAFGWRSMTVLGVDWRRDPNRVIQRIEAAVKGK